MKINIRKIALTFIFLVLMICIYSINTYAITKESVYIDVNEKQDFVIGDLYFQDVVFKDYSNISTRAFGLTGKILNTSNNNIMYHVRVRYYDINYTLLAEEISMSITQNGTNIFNQMSNLDILHGYSVDEICYYSIEISINDTDTVMGTVNNNLTPSKNYEYETESYVIDKYDIKINVNENNTFDITETITAYFNVPKHGIFRTIPLKNNIVRLDGTKDTNRTQISNVSVDKEYTTKRENGNYKIQIGSASYTVTGEQTYVINYTYNLGKDISNIYDEIYYNIIGTEWDTAIGNITFTITMPKEFDASKLGFSSGQIGSTDNSNVNYTVNGNVITGSYNGILGNGDGLTVRCELPEGYFVDAGLTVNKKDIIMFSIPVVFLIIAILMWNKYGRDDIVVETVEFYPPEGLNSLDVGFLYKGKAENKDVTSLIVYLANKGYIKIKDTKIEANSKKVNLSEESKKEANEKIIELQNKIEEETKKDPASPKIKYYQNMLNIYTNIDEPIHYEQYGVKNTINKYNNKNKYVFEKLKEYDGTDENERIFMEGLFECGDEVTEGMLYNKFYNTNNRILNRKNNKKSKNTIFEKSSTNKKWLCILMIIATYLLITIPPVLSYGEPEMLPFALIFPGVGFTILFTMVFGQKQVALKVIGLIWGSLFGGIPWLAMVLPVITQDIIYMIGYIIGIICIVGMVIATIHMPKRNKYGREMLGRINGFKDFLKTVEKERLEALVMENPNYFYDILPYTYVLDISEKWIKKFESMSLTAPDWYSSNDLFDIGRFGSFMNSTMTSAERSMTSSPSSSSGGGSSGGSSSGGGSSGGGSGGGGGGSW